MDLPAGSADGRQEVIDLCDDARALLGGNEPRLASARALLEKAAALAEETDASAEDRREIDALRARLRLMSENGPALGYKGWIIPGVFVVLAMYLVGGTVTASPKNLARKAEVTASSIKGDADPQIVVDGKIGGPTLVTQSEERPSVVLDLGRARDFDEIVLHRPEGKGPLEIEISLDGEVYGRYGTRGGGFDEWTVEKNARARYIRVVRPRKGSLRFAELEVIAK